jgi:hypothetical protein
MLIVPPHTVSAQTVGRITALADGYDVHIDGPWSGNVLVAFPVGSLPPEHVPLILHQVDSGQQVEETVMIGGMLVARTSSLSKLELLKCALRILPKDILKCLAKDGYRNIQKEALKTALKKGVDPFQCGDVTDVVGWLTDEPCHTGETLEDIERYTKQTKPASPQPSASESQAASSPTSAQPAPASDPATTAPAPPQNPSFSGGYTIADAYFGGTWPRTDPNDGTWYPRSTRPPNAASYWWANGLGVGFSCGTTAASYTVKFADGRKETWRTWLRSTDTWGGRVAGLWIPSAVADGVNVDGIPPGMPSC